MAGIGPRRDILRDETAVNAVDGRGLLFVFGNQALYWGWFLLWAE